MEFVTLTCTDLLQSRFRHFGRRPNTALQKNTCTTLVQLNTLYNVDGLTISQFHFKNILIQALVWRSCPAQMNEPKAFSHLWRDISWCKPRSPSSQDQIQLLLITPVHQGFLKANTITKRGREDNEQLQPPLDQTKPRGLAAH